MKIILDSELAELELTYGNGNKDEQNRKKTGSYYTPNDVAYLFWRQFDYCFDLLNKCKSTEFISNSVFIEPSAGAGILIFSLLHYLLINKIPIKSIAEIKFYIIDINSNCIDWIKHQFDLIQNTTGVVFNNLIYYCTNFIDLQLSIESMNKIYFGNPPFISNKNGEFYKNSFAEFLDKSIFSFRNFDAVQYILPLSFSFSREYDSLRKKVLSLGRNLYISHYDNIPDGLFKSGKPGNMNTNKSNSQRCSIVSISNSQGGKLFSTNLRKWNAKDRDGFLKSIPEFQDSTKYNFDTQIPRPYSKKILNYLSQPLYQLRLRDFLCNEGSEHVSVGTLSRNYIPFKENTVINAHRFHFKNDEDKYTFICIVASELFFEYWKTVGDGFHLTKFNIINFPVSNSVLKKAQSLNLYTKSIWERRENYKKIKLNAGKHVVSFDFNQAFFSHGKTIESKQNSG